MAKAADLGTKSISQLGLSPAVEAALRDVHEELAINYRESFLAMVEAINRQASALERIQTTLNILVNKLAPEFSAQVPQAIGIAPEGTRPDLASAIVVADPIGAGYTLSQAALAKALDLSAVDVSILVRAMKFDQEGDYAIAVRRGKKSTIINYHPRAINRFRSLIENLDIAGLDTDQKSALKRVRKKMRL